MPIATMHDALRPIAWLLGTWRGEGTGHYPSIEDFAYREELAFTHYGKPVVAYVQRTWSLRDGAPLHSEMGFWRPQADGRIELVLAHSFGGTEIQEGTIDGTRIQTASTTLGKTPSSKRIDRVLRTIELRDDVLHYDLAMAATGHELDGHLRGELRRDPVERRPEGEAVP